MLSMNPGPRVLNKEAVKDRLKGIKIVLDFTAQRPAGSGLTRGIALRRSEREMSCQGLLGLCECLLKRQKWGLLFVSNTSEEAAEIKRCCYAPESGGGERGERRKQNTV